MPNGFTLMELLIVIAIILILMLMAIPTIGSLTKKANETSAINSVQTITKAEIQYQSTYPANGFACTLPALGGDPNAGPPTPAAAQILQGDLTSGYKSGYNFTITCTTRSPSTAPTASNGLHHHGGSANRWQDRRSRLLQRPVRRHQVRPAGGTNCTQNLQ